MPESPRMVPLYVARVADLRVGTSISVTCRDCGHVAEVPALTIRAKVHPDEFVKPIGGRFRCTLCNFKGANIDARRALRYYG
jgi:primosomal protein N'